MSLFSILVPLWFIIISLVFFHLCKALFSGFRQFKGKFVGSRNTSKYRNRARGPPLRLLKTNSSQTTFEENIRNFATRLKSRGYPAATVEKHLSEVKFSERETSLTDRNRTTRKKILPFVTKHHPALPNWKEKLNHGELALDREPTTAVKKYLQEPPLISYRKGKFLKDIHVKAKL